MLTLRIPVVGLAATLLPVVWCSTLAPAPPAPSADKDAYLPSGLGDQLVYERTAKDKDGETKELVTESVTAVDHADGLVVTAEYRYGDEPKPRRTMRYRATDAGVFWIGRDGKDFEKPECCLKLPAREGDVWESAVGDRPSLSVSNTTGKEEEVEVPAGKFRTVRIDSVLKAKGFTLDSSDWYARGVGLVKSTFRTDDGETEVRVLKSYTPGKK
jgi:hypothetical protein